MNYLIKNLHTLFIYGLKKFNIFALNYNNDTIIGKSY